MPVFLSASFGGSPLVAIAHTRVHGDVGQELGASIPQIVPVVGRPVPKEGRHARGRSAPSQSLFVNPLPRCRRRAPRGRRAHGGSGLLMFKVPDRGLVARWLPPLMPLPCIYHHPRHLTRQCDWVNVNDISTLVQHVNQPLRRVSILQRHILMVAGRERTSLLCLRSSTISTRRR